MCQATRDLIIIAFFFLLRISEYTPKSKANQRTIPLQKKDFQLWKGPDPISRQAPLDVMLTADAVSICLENQKNGVKAQGLHLPSTGLPMDPVTATARRLDNLRNAPDHTGIYVFYNEDGSKGTINDKQIRSTITIAATETNLPAKGFPLNRLGSHSIRAGGAMALYLAGESEPTIKKLGRWKTDTWQDYIHPAIKAAGRARSQLTERMITCTLRFTNLAVIH